MAKTLILGNNPDKVWIKNLKLSIVAVPNISTGRNADIVDFIKRLPTDLDCVVIDSDSLNFNNIELPLDIALYIRMMLHVCLKTSLSKILIVSDLPIDSFMDFGVKSMILMTKGIVLSTDEYIDEAIEQSDALTPIEYVDGFLNLIKVEPQEKIEGRHSIANEWGAEVLAKVITNGKASIGNKNTKDSLYFLYSTLTSLVAKDIENIIDSNCGDDYKGNTPVEQSLHYLLIDDEAKKGWQSVLEIMLPNAQGTVFDGKITEYNQLPESIRNDLKHNKIDLIFLDLRMNGVEEESISMPDEFSGMRILKSIKSLNPGLQVIMLTATNKSWNLKALIDAGADGYYMKEAPEYHFPISYSEQNYATLKTEIGKCLQKGFLKDVYRRIEKIDLPSSFSDLERLIKNQLLLSFDLIKKANTATEYSFAYIALEQVFEFVAESLYAEEGSGNEWRCYLLDSDGIQHEYNIRDLRKYFYIGNVPTATPMWIKIASIYYGLFKGSDSEFAKNVQSDIKLRNDYIHDNEKPVITLDDYQNLFDSVIDLISVFQ